LATAPGSSIVTRMAPRAVSRQNVGIYSQNVQIGMFNNIEKYLDLR
jgi:hypothetical protein